MEKPLEILDSSDETIEKNINVEQQLITTMLKVQEIIEITLEEMQPQMTRQKVMSTPPSQPSLENLPCSRIEERK
jgi:hypothetical protein